MKPLTERVRARWAMVGPLTVLLLFCLAVAAPAQGPEARGEQLQQALEQGRKQCADLGNGDFEALGELAMGRMAGSPRAHAAMNGFMKAIMSPAGEEQMHEFLGRRFSSCAGGSFPAGAGSGRMMGALGMMGSMMGGYGRPEGPGPRGAPGSLMDGRGSGAGPGSMMGYGNGARSNLDDDQGPPAAAMAGMIAVLIAAGALFAFFLRPRRSSKGALDLLEQRLARGDLSPEEYKRDKQLLHEGD